MKPNKPEAVDEMRAEYTRENLGPIVRGKYAAQYAKASNIVVIEPSLLRAFPNADAVNGALRGLLAVATAATNIAPINAELARPKASRKRASA